MITKHSHKFTTVSELRSLRLIIIPNTWTSLAFLLSARLYVCVCVCVYALAQRLCFQSNQLLIFAFTSHWLVKGDLLRARELRLYGPGWLKWLLVGSLWRPRRAGSMRATAGAARGAEGGRPFYEAPAH